MSLRIIKLEKNGDASEEYLLLQADEALNLKDYVVRDRTYHTDGTVSNVFRHTFQFPDKELTAGDYVSLRTASGTNGMGTLSSGAPVYRVYWGSEAAIWNDRETESVEVLKITKVAGITAGNTNPYRKLIRRPGTGNPFQ